LILNPKDLKLFKIQAFSEFPFPKGKHICEFVAVPVAPLQSRSFDVLDSFQELPLAGFLQ
jgi:hypothetical protein